MLIGTLKPAEIQKQQRQLQYTIHVHSFNTCTSAIDPLRKNRASFSAGVASCSPSLANALKPAVHDASNSSRSEGGVTQTKAPIKDPADEPEMIRGSNPFSCSALMTPKWCIPKPAPPLSSNADRPYALLKKGREEAYKNRKRKQHGRNVRVRY